MKSKTLRGIVIILSATAILVAGGFLSDHIRELKEEKRQEQARIIEGKKAEYAKVHEGIVKTGIAYDGDPHFVSVRDRIRTYERVARYYGGSFSVYTEGEFTDDEGNKMTKEEITEMFKNYLDEFGSIEEKVIWPKGKIIRNPWSFEE